MWSRIRVVMALMTFAVVYCPPWSAEAGEDQSQVRNHDMFTWFDPPQVYVVCTGAHALCDFADDCIVSGDTASCKCWSVDEQHIVATSKIQDKYVKRLTERRCTLRTPCDVDEAPVCKAIQAGKFRVDGIFYEWVSTYSYRGWCENWKPFPCDIDDPDYKGERIWADCMSAPCTENDSMSDRPLTCQCRVEASPFVGSKGSCFASNGGDAISTFTLVGWDFDNNTYRFPPPGYEFVGPACAALKSDPLTH